MGPPDVRLAVQGMMCQKNCGSTVEKALMSHKGVEKVVVSYSESSAFVWGVNLDVDDLIGTIEMVGYDAERMGCSDSNESGASPSSLPKTPPTKSKKIKPAVQLSPSSSSSSSSSSSGTSPQPQSLAAMCEVNLRVSGMSCASCARAVKDSSMGIPGVVSAEVALIMERVLVRYDSEAGADIPREIVRAITERGYSASVESDVSCEGGVSVSYVFVLGSGGSLAVMLVDKIKACCAELPGVVAVSYQDIRQRLTVSVIPSDEGHAAGVRDIYDAVEGLGVPVQRVMEDGLGTTSEEEELKSVMLLLVVSLVLGIPITVLHFLTEFDESVRDMTETPAACSGGATWGQLIMLLLNLPMQFGVGWKFYRNAYMGAMHGILGMDALVCIGTSITFVYSTISLMEACESEEATKHVFFEASGMLIMFVNIGKFFESYAKGATSAAIRNLLQMQPQRATLVVSEGAESAGSPTASPTSTSKTTSPMHLGDKDDMIPKSLTGVEELRDIPIGLIQRGDVLKVLPGAQIPTDGTVVGGSSFVDEAMITGESTPVSKSVGASVYGSTTNQGRALYVRADADSLSSALHQIVKMIETAQMSKPPTQDFADKLAEMFTPVILCIATVVFIVWTALGEAGIIPKGWFAEEYGSPVLFALLAATSVVVISCPCALGLATPTAIMVGTSVGASNGILIKSGAAFESAHNLHAIIFDKTGTLTEGKPSVTDVRVVAPNERVRNKRSSSISMTSNSNRNGAASARSKGSAASLMDKEFDEDEVVRLAALAERDSEHLIAKAILASAKSKGLHLKGMSSSSKSSASASDESTGKEKADVDDMSKARIGVEVVCDEEGGTVRVGSREFMEDRGLTVGGNVDAAMWDLEVQGKTAVLVAVELAIIGVIAVADRPKDEAYGTVAALQEMGVEVWMVTGDQRTTAHAIADELNIPRNHVVAGAMPMMKVSKVEELQNLNKGSVAMIGDGMNDSPALSLADIGIAIGEGTKLAIDAADMVLVRNNLLDVVVAVDLARKVFSKIRTNFFLALVYNGLAIPFAAGILYPWTHMLIPPQYAGLSMALSSISVVISSLSLNLYRRPLSTRPPDAAVAQSYAQLSMDEELESGSGMAGNIQLVRM